LFLTGNERLIDPGISVVPIVLLIFAGLFFMQQFGTNIVGASFGPIMVIWFLMLGILGFSQLIHYPVILHALNPVYAPYEISRSIYPARGDLSLYDRGRGSLFRPGTLRTNKYPRFMDICEDNSYP